MSDMEILDHLPSLHFAILCYEHGKLDSFMVDSGEITEEYYSCFFSAIHAAADFISEDYNESYNVSKFYFSWDSMMEYYRLCREYSKRFGVSRKDNPYMCEAEDFVEQTMLFDHYGGGYGFHLQTRVNHRWASGLIVWLDEYFNSEFELAEALLEIGTWFRGGVERLKEVLAAPQVKAWKEAA